MSWQSAEEALQSYIDAGWASSPYASVPLIYENSLDDPVETYVFVAIEGTYAEKTMFGGPGKRLPHPLDHRSTSGQILRPDPVLRVRGIG